MILNLLRFTLVAWLLWLAPLTAQATNFAILLGEPPDPKDPPAIANNPLYDADEQEHNPLFEPKALYFSPTQLWQGQPVEFVVNMDNSLPQNVPAAPHGGFVFELLLRQLSDGALIHQLAQPLSIGIDAGTAKTRSIEFGYFDETEQKWQAQGTTTSSDSKFLCGKTDHLSLFYVAAVPEPASYLLAIVGLGGLALPRCARARRPRR